MTDDVTDDDTRDGQDAGESAGGDETFDAIAAVAELEAAMAAVDAQGPSGGSDRYTEMLESEVLELNALLEKKDEAIARAEARADHAREEIERAKTRLAGEAARQLERRTNKVLLDLLEVLDELDRALSSFREGGHDPELVTGVERVQRRFVSMLESHGVRRCSAMGQPFDPAIHEAVTTTPCPDDQDGTVVAVMREGYTAGDTLLRPAAVVVGRAG